MRALIIDDSRAMRGILSKILGELGFDTFQASDGMQALERLRESVQFNLALVDWNMPQMSGYEFVQKVRADEAFDDLVLVMVTTETEMAQVVKALEAGANEYIMKPFTKDVLADKLDLLGLLDAEECATSES